MFTQRNRKGLKVAALAASAAIMMSLAACSSPEDGDVQQYTASMGETGSRLRVGNMRMLWNAAPTGPVGAQTTANPSLGRMKRPAPVDWAPWPLAGERRSVASSGTPALAHRIRHRGPLTPSVARARTARARSARRYRRGACGWG